MSIFKEHAFWVDYDRSLILIRKANVGWYKFKDY